MTAVLRKLVAFALLGTWATGCSYQSSYVPPQDGRARPVWTGDQIAVHAPKKLPGCKGVPANAPPPSAKYKVPHDDDGYYRPGPRVRVGVVIVHHHHHPTIVHIPAAHGASSSSSSSNTDGGEALVVVLAVGAIVAFPFIALGLAMGHPEPEDDVATAIDRVNRFNDEAREREAYCGAVAAGAEVTP